MTTLYSGIMEVSVFRWVYRFAVVRKKNHNALMHRCTILTLCSRFRTKIEPLQTLILIQYIQNDTRSKIFKVYTEVDLLYACR
jgi:hypothetical protein